MRSERPRGPDFLVIGAQRAGTTWLHRALGQHPALWFPPVKELHYFNQLTRRRTWLDAGERRRVKLRNLKSIDRWHLSYLLGLRGDEWYANLFLSAQRRGLMAGEITPSYAVLNEEGFRRVLHINNKIKLVFIMRDPVDRAWSTVTNAYRKGRLNGLTLTEALSWAASPEVAARSNYLETIRKVEAVFSNEQLYYGFFDDLCDRPEQFVDGVVSFLGVEPTTGWLRSPPPAVNSTGRNAPMPPEFAREMAKAYLPVVLDLCRRFDGPPQNWRIRYERLLDA
jgi:hypothetical protein